MAEPCFKEIGRSMFNYDVFEGTVQDILAEVNYTENQVIRWEMTGQRLNKPRAGKMPQYWFRVPGESGPNIGHNGFFASESLVAMCEYLLNESEKGTASSRSGRVSSFCRWWSVL